MDEPMTNRQPAARLDPLLRQRQIGSVKTAAAAKVFFVFQERKTMSRQRKNQSPLFPLGQVVATPGALAALEQAGRTPQEFLDRHVGGDWGDLCTEDKRANDLALRFGHRIFSAYPLKEDLRLWLITEWDRSVTTLLLPAEY